MTDKTSGRVVPALAAAMTVALASLGSGCAADPKADAHSAQTAHRDPSAQERRHIVPPPGLPTGPVRLGTEVNLGQLKVTALRYRTEIAGAPGNEPLSGHRWDAALVRACNTAVTDPKTIPLITSYANWSVVDRTNTYFTELDMAHSPAPVPQWKNDTLISPGSCASGWVALDVKQGASVASLTYSIEGFEFCRWNVAD